MEPKRYRPKGEAVLAIGPVNLYGSWDDVSEIRDMCNGQWHGDENGKPEPHDFTFVTPMGRVFAEDGCYITMDHQGNYNMISGIDFIRMFEEVPY